MDANQFTTRYYFSAVVFAEGQFRAFTSGRNKAVQSPDGTNWTVVEITGEPRVTQMIHAAGQYVAVGYGISFEGQPFPGLVNYAYISTSPDGTNWTQRVGGLRNYALYGIAHAEGVFVAVGSDGIFFLSEDGVEWRGSPINGAAGEQFQSVTYGHGVFLCASVTSGRVFTSAEGYFWMPAGTAGIRDPIKVQAGPDRFIAVGWGETIMGLNPAATLSLQADLAPTVTISGVPLVTYRVERSSALGESNWTPLFTTTLLTNSYSSELGFNTNVVRQRFYRAVTVP